MRLKSLGLSINGQWQVTFEVTRVPSGGTDRKRWDLYATFVSVANSASFRVSRGVTLALCRKTIRGLRVMLADPSYINAGKCPGTELSQFFSVIRQLSP